MTPKLSKVSTIEAMIRPRLTIPKEVINMITTDIKNECAVRGMPIKKDKLKIMSPWIKAVVQPPKALPMKIDVLETGATRISFKKPNSLSQITDIPLEIDIVTKDMATIPGNKKL
jgi:hypothetical protein